MQSYGRHLARRAGVRRIQSLRTFRRPDLDAWMLGCFEDWSIGGDRVEEQYWKEIRNSGLGIWD